MLNEAQGNSAPSSQRATEEFVTRGTLKGETMIFKKLQKLCGNNNEYFNSGHALYMKS